MNLVHMLRLHGTVVYTAAHYLSQPSGRCYCLQMPCSAVFSDFAPPPPARSFLRPPPIPMLSFPPIPLHLSTVGCEATINLGLLLEIPIPGASIPQSQDVTSPFPLPLPHSSLPFPIVFPFSPFPSLPPILLEVGPLKSS